MKATKLLPAPLLGLLGAAVACVSYAQQPVVSDTFNTNTLNAALWTVVDPGGISGGSFGDESLPDDAHLAIHVPGGDYHDGWNPNDLVRVMQHIGDVNFTVEAKFDSLPSTPYSEEGILVGSGTWGLRFDAARADGSAYLHHYVVENLGQGSVYSIADVALTNYPTPPDNNGTIYLRVNRFGQVYTSWVSSNRTNWTQLSSFVWTLTPDSIGVYAGNDGTNGHPSAPDFTALVDYFYNDDILPGSTNVPPTITLTSPANNTIYAAGGGVTVNMTASDSDGIVTNISLIDNYSNVISSLEVNAASGNYSITWTNLPAGVHILAGMAIDDTGTRTYSPTRRIYSLLQGSITSDDFNGPIDPTRWVFVDPLGDDSYTVVGAGTGESSLQINVSGAQQHDSFQAWNAPRLMQLVTNQDFTVVAKFDTVPSIRGQIEGVCFIDSNGVGVRVDAAACRVDSGPLEQWSGTKIAQGGAQVGDVQMTWLPRPPTGINLGSAYIEVQKSGNDWSVWSSANGVDWNGTVNFSYAMTVNSVGVYGDNAYTTHPAFSPKVDYFMNLDAPLSVEDGSSNQPPQVSLTTPLNGDGLTTPVSLSVNATESSGSIAKVDYYYWLSGMTNPVFIATSTSPAPSFNAQWTNVAPGTYYVLAKATANAGAVAWTPFTTVVSVYSGPGGNVVSDDFNASTINSNVWQKVNPLGDGTYSIAGAFTGNADLVMNVPAGTKHDPFGSPNNSIQLMQTVANQSFEVIAKFDTIPTASVQEEGILVKAPNGDYRRFNIQGTGGTNITAFASKNVGTTGTAWANLPVPNVVPPVSGNDGTVYLKVNWDGLYWDFFVSPDGTDTNWWEVVSLTDTFTVAQVGLYAGNAGSNPAFAAKVDYFANTASPLTNEDGLVLPQMAFGVSGGKLVISWNNGASTLTSATNVTGPYYPVPGATNPYTNSMSDKQRFFQLR